MVDSEAKKAPVSGWIAHDPKTCTGCGLCELMCSLYHEGEQGQALSRGELTGDRLTAEFTYSVCLQCSSPECYDACPIQDEALCIDGVTGTKYIDAEKCDSCGDCIEACPFDPPRIKIHPEKNVEFMCDLCRDRAEGPVCIEYCDFEALKLAGKEER